MSFFGSSSTAATATPAATEKDIEVADPPSDSISSMAFSPQADYLAVASWDNNVCAIFVILATVSNDYNYTYTPPRREREWGLVVMD